MESIPRSDAPLVFRLLSIMAVAFFLALVAGTGRAESESVKEHIKQDAHHAGQGIKHAAKEVKRGAKRAGKAVGHAAKETGHAIKRGAKKVKRAVKGEA